MPSTAANNSADAIRRRGMMMASTDDEAEPPWSARAALRRPRTWYAGFAHSMERLTGRPATFALAAALIVVWLVTGPLFHFSDTWQLVINTGTTIVTFLMVFVIQNAQNRDTEAIQIKLDELIRATRGAHNALLDLEELEAEQLDEFRGRYEKLAQEARSKLRRGLSDTGTPDC
jgi:low affinity Fe/Cu permease